VIGLAAILLYGLTLFASQLAYPHFWVGFSRHPRFC
jgi:hypothetical protein